MEWTSLLVVLLPICDRSLISKACNLPSDWTGTWVDSFSLTYVTFSSSQVLTGWEISTHGGFAIQTWSCISHDVSNSLLLLKSDQSSSSFGIALHAYRCVEYTKITTYSYRYSVKNNIEGNYRMLVNDTDGTTSSYCDVTPPTYEYHFMVKNDSTQLISEACPDILRTSFNYTFNDGSTEVCSSGSLSFCDQTTTGAFNYSVCSSEMAYSKEGGVRCIRSVTDGSKHYILLFNTGIIDFVTYFPFTCIAMEQSGTAFYISDSRGSCANNQIPTTKTNDGRGTLVMFKDGTCEEDSDRTNSASSDYSYQVPALTLKYERNIV
ncbi:uncharacterized protein LOC125680211 [Ostrea edulis]|uniref:uncharacterized protein LOC125680211 n=1 Tax=Ostrea edulis TaxID=37623 RepID=UPI0024AF1989|nr:uncharacterized protein LOC125680211 [Ostrea edulis]